MDLDALALADKQRLANWEIEREPRLHTRGVLRRLSTVENVLVELCSKVARESVDLTLHLLNSEVKAAIKAHRLSFSLWQILQLILIRVGQVTESENILALFSTGVRRAVDFHYVGELVRVQLLREADTTRDALVCIDTHFIPKHLATQGHQMVGVSPRKVDTLRLQEFLRGNQAFG